jgi:Mn-dependent DtxR family transcriptional regulator/Fe2+ transport system protein FeoA
MARELAEKSDISKIVKEDTLRILGERKAKVPLKSLKAKIRVSPSLLSEVIESLEKEGLVYVEKESVSLTKNGEDEARDIVEKHLVLERYFKETRSEGKAHQAAHLLEHYVSEEVIKNIKKMFTLRDEGVSLINFESNQVGLITDITSSDYKLFERMISMGLLPGQVIIVTHNIPSGIIVRINNKKIVLDKSIAKEIRALEYEAS